MPSSHPASSNGAYHWRKCAISWATRRYRSLRRSVTTTRRGRHYRLRRPNWRQARNSTPEPSVAVQSQDSLKIGNEEPNEDRSQPDVRTDVNACEEKGLQDWLAVRDDFRTWVIESAV